MTATRSLAAKAASPHAVYRAYDSYGNPLYIGRSGNPFARLATHSATDVGRQWTPHAARVEIDWYPSFADAAEAERDAILREEPGFNRQGLTVPWPKPLNPPRQPVHPPRRGPEPEPPPIDYQAVILRMMARMKAAAPPAQRNAPLLRTTILRRALSTLPKSRRRGASPKLRAALDTLAETPRSRVLENDRPEVPLGAQPLPRTYQYLEVIGERDDPYLQPPT